ncbi:MAG TPA: HAD family hydrolase [Dermatophilaceae bacterium]|nr:HAD family hydrolase [Dermatophilaceae bacterium]HMT88461.1 HAD family hydrolase [Dermatophilaceae bacterium]
MPRHTAYRPGRKLIGLDIDGTIISHAGDLDPRVRDSIRAVADAGHHVVIATGRSVVATMPILEMLGISRGYAVCSNGAVTLRLDPKRKRGYKVLEKVTFDPKPALTLLRDELPDALVAVEVLGRGFLVSSPFPEGELGGKQKVVPWERLLERRATRVTLRMPDTEPDAFMAHIERIGLHEVSYAVGWTAWLDINPEGVSKGAALELMRRRLEVEPADTVAVGDQRNDIEMLQWAARGVAMGNAPDEVKAVADEVTGDVHHAGLADVLESLLD